MTPFELNVLAYEQRLPELLATAEGKFVLLRQAQIVDVLDTEDAAMAAGYARFGIGEFVIKEVLRSDLDLLQRK